MKQTTAFSAILALAVSSAAWGGGFAGLNERITFRTYQTLGGFLGIGADYPEVAGEVEWIAATDAGRSRLCLLMVNSKKTSETVIGRTRFLR